MCRYIYTAYIRYIYTHIYCNTAEVTPYSYLDLLHKKVLAILPSRDSCKSIATLYGTDPQNLLLGTSHISHMVFWATLSKYEIILLNSCQPEDND